MSRSRRGQSWNGQSLAAAVSGLIIFMVIYAYSGDADLLFAAMGGIAGALISYVTIWLHAKGIPPK